MSVVRFLNKDLVRLKRNGVIHQLHFENARVQEEDMDWNDRITLYKDKRSGRVLFSIIPPSGEPFISFPIITDFTYTWNPISDDISKFAREYNLERLINFKLFPHMSMQILESFDVPISRISSRTIEVFGKGEKPLWQRIYEIEPDLRHVEYKRLNLGGIMSDRVYKIGESFPHQSPSSFIAKITDENKLANAIYKGNKEIQQMKLLRGELNNLESRRSKNLYDVELLKTAYDYYTDKMDFASDNLEVSTLSKINIRSSSISDEDDFLIEEENEKLRSSKDKKLEILENKIIEIQEDLINTQIRINDSEEEIEEINGEINKKREEMENLLNKYNILKEKAELSAIKYEN